MEMSMPSVDERQNLLDHGNEDAAALFTGFAPPPHTKTNPLARPLCLPQLSWNDNSPFMRAYSDELKQSGIEMHDWLNFVYVLLHIHHFPSQSDRGPP